jgi:hypothetical protein
MELSNGFNDLVGFMRGHKADQTTPKFTPSQAQLISIYMKNRQFENYSEEEKIVSLLKKCDHFDLAHAVATGQNIEA